LTRGVKDQIKLGGNTVDTSKQKPDLMSPARGAADSSKRILAHLEHGLGSTAKPARTAGWSIDGWTIGLCVLLLTMSATAWMMHKKTITPDSFKPARASIGVPVTQAVGPSESSPAAEGGSDQVAAIVNEPAAMQSTAGTPAAPSTEQAVPKARSATMPRNAAAAKVTARVPSAPATAADTDVALLTALVAHAAQPTMVTPERNRDVVERQEGDSTAQLLARCKQLGLIEGMLCRSRICSGRWESDPACRAPSH
jgi:hypothetical protein